MLHAEPIPPSKVVASHNAKELRGDLDTVVLKALKKRSTERYATAAEFADDLESLLAQHPVKARPDSDGTVSGFGMDCPGKIVAIMEHPGLMKSHLDTAVLPSVTFFRP